MPACAVRKALEQQPCRCLKLIDANRCPLCGELLYPVKYDMNSMLNREQFDAVRAGDYYCKTCKGAEASTGFKYFWEREFASRVETCARCAALAAPCCGENQNDLPEVPCCPIHEGLWKRGQVKPLDNCFVCIRNERDELRKELTDAVAVLRGLAKIEMPNLASDGTWVAKTLYCNDMVTAYQVRRAAAVVAHFDAKQAGKA